MAINSERPTSALSRRRLVKAAALFAGVGIVGGSSAAQAAKLPQKGVAYQDTPKGKARCDACTQWQAPAACKVVLGEIAPSGWCTLYVQAQKAG